MTIICGISLMLQLVFWYGIFNRIYSSIKSIPDESTAPSVCILICVKNGADLLLENLPKILSQDYPNFTILIANDFSTDNTSEVIQLFTEKDKRVNSFDVKSDIPGKKQALIEAIDYINSEWIVFTDVDCIPSSNNWITHVICPAQKEKKDIVLAYSPYQWGRSFLSKWVAFENWLTGVFYLSFAANKMPYMGVGRNMAIRTSTYNKNAIKSHQHLISGDDDLTVQSLIEPNNYFVQVHSDAFVWTKPPSGLLRYFKQKLRHYSTADSYPFSIKFALIVFPLSQLIFSISVLFLLINSPLIGLYFLIIRWVLVVPVYRRLSKMLQLNLSIFWFVLMDALLAIYYTIFGFSFIFPKSKEWN